MSDYISKQSAIEGFYEMSSNTDYLCTVGDYVHFLESLPSTDIVEVVRCKDCKWSIQHMIFGREALMCKREKYMDPRTVEQDGFCNYGERKDGSID